MDHEGTYDQQIWWIKIVAEDVAKGQTVRIGGAYVSCLSGVQGDHRPHPQKLTESGGFEWMFDARVNGSRTDRTKSATSVTDAEVLAALRCRRTRSPAAGPIGRNEREPQ